MDQRLITCPYNTCHKIKPERIQYHLVKCRKQHPNMDLVVCPYNATHHVQREDEERHIHECEDRRIIDVQKFRFNDQTPGQHGFLANPTFYGSSLIVQDYYTFRDDESSLNESMSVVMRDQSFRSQISAGGASRSSRSRKSAWDTGPSYPTAKDIFLRRNTTAMTPLRRPQAVSDVDSLAAASSRVDDRNTHGAIFIGSRRNSPSPMRRSVTPPTGRPIRIPDRFLMTPHQHNAFEK